MAKKLTQEQFIEKCINIHGNTSLKLEEDIVREHFIPLNEHRENRIDEILD